METKGFTLNEIEKEVYISNKCILKRLGNKTYEFQKEQTYEINYFLWCGYTIIPEKVEMIMKFDILFLSDIPTKDDKMFIKTHEPVDHYNDWLIKCKKNEFIHIEQPLYLSKIEQLIIFIMDECLKPVHFIVKNIEFVPSEINYRFISFYTQGQSYDNCFDLTDCANIYENKIKKYVDYTHFYNASELKKKEETAYLVEEFQDEPIYNKKTNLIGYLRWKPYIILKTLLESNDGDIVYYRDSNINKYPEVLISIEYTIRTLQFVLNKNDIYTPVELYPYIKTKKHVKREVFEYFDSYNKENIESYLLNASIIVCRKNDITIKFMNEWLNACKNNELISSNYGGGQDIDFKWNTQEQAIMNVLINKYIQSNLFPRDTNRFSIYNRVFSISSLKKVNRVAILLAGEMRNFDNIELINKNNLYLFQLYNCDVFVSTWSKRGYSPYHGNVSKKNYSDNQINENTIKNIYNCKNINIENYDEWFDKLPENYKELYNKGLQCGDKLVKATVFSQLYKIWDCNRIKKEYEEQHQFKYDLVIRFRPDMCLVEEIPNNFLHDFLNIDLTASYNKIYTLNPPKIFYPNRIYDIFFYGNSEAMNKISDSWYNILDLINNNFENGLEKVDSCRVLYVQCLLNNLNVINISRCIGDIYRDEDMNDYIHKICNIFN